MSLRTQIKAIVDGMLVVPPAIEGNANTSPGFIFGTAKEINEKADDQTKWPQVCLYPMQPIDIKLGINGSASNWFSLYMEFLYKTKFEKNSEDNEPLIMQAIGLANLFLTRLRDFKELPGNATYFEIDKSTTARAFPVYNSEDVNTCGVSLTIKVKVRQDQYLLNCATPVQPTGFPYTLPFILS